MGRIQDCPWQALITGPSLVGDELQSLGQNMCTWEDGLALSREACSLWGKSDYGLQRAWLPLFVHMADSSATAFRLWDHRHPGDDRRAVRHPGSDCYGGCRDAGREHRARGAALS